MMQCVECHGDIEFFESHCRRCGQFIGFPNVRKAREHHGALAKRYDQARAGARRRGVDDQVEHLLAMTSNAVIVLNMRLEVISNLLNDQKYLSYYQALDAGLRHVAEERFHIERSIVDSRLFPNYHSKILFAAMSASDSGLVKYGPVCVVIRDYVVLKNRVSLMEKNSFLYYDEYNLGSRKVEEPFGYRCDWDHRGQLAVAKLESRVDRSMSHVDCDKLILVNGIDREHDEFIEAHIYDSVDIRDIAAIRLQEPLTDSDARDEWKLIESKAAKRGTPVSH